MSTASASPTALKRRVRRKARTVPTIIALTLVGGIGWFAYAKSRPAENPAGKMLTDTVKRGDLIESVSATGSVTAQTGAQVKIGSQITGRIKRLYADVGSFVKAGGLIAELDLPDIQAQLEQARANQARAAADLAQAEARLNQQITGVPLAQSTASTGVAQARADLRRAQSRLASAEAAARLQQSQTPTGIRQAEANLESAKAALASARATLKQREASNNLEISTAQQQVEQARATASNSAVNLKRQRELLGKGFVAQSVVDQAEATDRVNQSLVMTAQQNVRLVRERVEADLQAARNAVTSAQQDVSAREAALSAARGATNSDDARAADVADARAGIRQAQAALEAALANTRQVTLKNQDVDAARQAVAASRQALRAAEQQVKFYEAQLDKTFIRSPISGTVLQLASQQGETLAAGLSAPTLIIVADLKRLEVDVFVDETDIGKIKIGQEAEVTVDAFPKKKFKGRVVKIGSGSTIQQGVITYAVTVALDDKTSGLKPDMTAAVTLETGKRANVLLVPSEAVKIGQRGSTVNLAVKNDEGKIEPKPTPVETGASDGVQTEIVEGLKEGDQIVLAGGNNGRGGRGGNSNPFGPRQQGGGGGGGGRGGGR